MFNIEREKVILFIAKWISYILNTMIILAILAFIGWWGQQLYLSTLPTNYHHR
jgi:hypothetical protein